MPTKPNPPYNFLKIKQLSELGYTLIGDLPDETLRWPILKMKKRMGLFLFVRNNRYYQCQDSFLRDDAPLELNAAGELVNPSFSLIDTLSYIFVIVQAHPAKEGMAEKFMLLLRESLESGHSVLAGPYFETPLSKLVVGGEMHLEDGQLFMINNKSGCFKNKEYDVRYLLNKLFGEALTTKVFCPDHTEEEVKASYEQMSPRASARKLPEPSVASRSKGLLSPISTTRTLSSFLTPKTSPRTLSAMSALQATTVLTRSLKIVVQEEEKTIPSLPACPHQALSLFAHSNPLIEFIQSPSHACGGLLLTQGIKLLSAALIKYPNSVLNIMRQSGISASYLLMSLNDKIQRHNQRQEVGCVNNLENLYKRCLPHLVKLCVHSALDLERCIAVMPSYTQAIWELVLTNPQQMWEIFFNTTLDTPLAIKTALADKYPSFKDRIEECYTHCLGLSLNPKI